MARPPNPAPVWSDVDIDRWEAEPQWMDACRQLGQGEAFKMLLTVLTNERPSRKGERDASFSLGYEDCLMKLEFLAKGHARPRANEPAEADYIQKGTLAELGWQGRTND